VVKKKGLSKGLESLFGDNPPNLDLIEQVDKEHDTIVEIPLDEIRPNPHQPRKTFDEEKLNELAASIKENGLLQPIVVVKSSIKGYNIVAGERRFRAFKLLGLPSIEAVVRDYTEKESKVLALLENVQREDLNPIDTAFGYESLMTNPELPLTQEEVAKVVGKSRPVIANYLRLITLPAPVQELVRTGQLNPSLARAILGLKDKKKIEPLAKKVIAEGLSNRQIEQLVKEMNEGKTKVVKPPTKNKPYYIVESEELLMDKFGTNVVISDKGNKGRIEIEYVSQADLTRILDLLEVKLED